MLLALRSLYSPSLGVLQPGGAGTTIYIYDDTLSASGSTYTLAEIATALPSDFTELGTGNKTYRSKVTLQIGDTGTGVAKTTLTVVNAGLSFDSGKVLTMRASQFSSWYLLLGTKIAGFSTKDGVDMSFGATTTLRGNLYIYGSKLRSTAGMGLLPNLGAIPLAGVGELIGNIFQWGNAIAQFGNPSSGNFSTISRNTFVGVGAASPVQGFGADSADQNVFGGTGQPRFIASAVSQLNLARPQFSGTPSLADVRDTHGGSPFVDWNFAEPAWSQNAAQFDNVVGMAEWWGFGVVVFDSQTKARLANIPVEVVNIFGTTVVDTTTDSEGQISFGSGLFLNRIQLRRHSGGAPTIAEYGPFTLKVNHKGAVNYTYEIAYKRSIVWPGRNYAQGRQLQNVFLSVPLTNVTVRPSVWTACEV